MFKRRPVILVAISAFWIVYMAFSVGMFVIKTKDVVNDKNDQRLELLNYQNFIASPLMVEGQVDALVENLEAARKAGLFEFYVLKKDGQIISSAGGVSQGFDINATDYPMGQKQVGQALVSTIGVDSGKGVYKLSTGIEMLNGRYIAKALNYFKWDFVQDFVIVTLMLAGLLYLVLKDILDLTKILRSHDRSKAQLVKVRTKEADVLLAVTSQYEKISRSLKLSNETLSESLSPAVRYELSEGTQVPHLFPAFVVRIDVNGYTQMFLERKDEFVTETLNNYFQRASEIIHRYGGHIYQFVGDEIVFHFKELDLENAKVLALSAVRSVFEIAEDMDQDLSPKGVPFKVKASVAHGRLRFVKLDTGYAFAGLPLIESVRMLGKIDERDTNVVALYGEDFRGLETIAKPFKRLEVAFKGFNKQSEIVEVRDFAIVDEVIKGKKWDDLAHFRSDRDLAKILAYVAVNLEHLPVEDFMEIYKVIRQFPIQKVGGEVAEKFADLFVVADRLAQGQSPKSPPVMILSSVTHLAAQLLRSGAFDERVRAIMEKNLDHEDQRVRGNTIVALDELSPESYNFRQMFSLPFNRAAADALFVEGKREYTEEVHGFLKNFIESEDPFFMASALYVLGALYMHHRTVDPVYFKANGLLESIPSMVESCLNHKDPMVARRAEISLTEIRDGDSVVA